MRALLSLALSLSPSGSRSRSLSLSLALSRSISRSLARPLALSRSLSLCPCSMQLNRATRPRRYRGAVHCFGPVPRSRASIQAAVERIKHTSDSQGQILASAFRYTRLSSRSLFARTRALLETPHAPASSPLRSPALRPSRVQETQRPRVAEPPCCCCKSAAAPLRSCLDGQHPNPQPLEITPHTLNPNQRHSRIGETPRESRPRRGGPCPQRRRRPRPIFKAHRLVYHSTLGSGAFQDLHRE